MKTIKYLGSDSLHSFMDRFAIQRLKSIVHFEKVANTLPDAKLIESCQTVIKHLESLWVMK